MVLGDRTARHETIHMFRPDAANDHISRELVKAIQSNHEVVTLVKGLANQDQDRDVNINPANNFTSEIILFGSFWMS